MEEINLVKNVLLSFSTNNNAPPPQITKVINKDTKELIRQIPTEDNLKLKEFYKKIDIYV